MKHDAKRDKDKKPPQDKGDPRGSREQSTIRGGTKQEEPEKGDKSRFKNK